MKTMNFFLPLIFGILFLNCSNNKKPENLLNYKIIKNDVYDAPIKTQVQLDVLILEKSFSEKKVRDLLQFLYDKTISRTGFKYHANPTNIFIYVFSSKEKAESGMGQWVGMISKSYDDSNPTINISETQLNSQSMKSLSKFGLTENERIEIWNKSIKIEDKAQKEADKKFPLNKIGITMNEIKKNTTLSEKLIEKYKKELAEEYKIKKEVIDSISVEGLTKGWPFPKY